MFKFFRKHGKWLLAIFGVLLMIVFLVPEAITRLGQQAASGGAVLATIGDGEEVKAKTYDIYRTDLEIFERQQAPVGDFGVLKDPWHWFLLVREAEQAGLTGGLASDSLPAEVLAQLLADVRYPATQINEAFGRFLGVNRMLQTYMLTSEFSDVRLKHEAARLFHAVDAEIMVIQAAVQDEAPMPSEEALLEQFNAYRDTAPGEGEHGFGYLLPDRFKLEWLSIPSDSVTAMLETGAGVDTVALMKYWQEHQEDENRNPVTGEATAKYPPLERGAEVPEQVRADYVQEQKSEKLAEIRRFINSRLDNSRRQLRRVEGYYELPEDWSAQRLALTDLAQQVQQKFPGLDLPAYEAVGDRWLTTEDLGEFAALSGISTRLLDPLTPHYLPALIDSTREFGSKTQSAYLIQEGIAGPILATRTDDLIVFRITATDAARPPANVEEVRGPLVEDLQRKAHYDALVAQLGELEQAAHTEGLLALAIRNDTDLKPATDLSLYSRQMVRLQQQYGIGLSPAPSPLPVIGLDEEVLGEIIDRAMAFPADRALKEVPTAERTFALPADDSMAVLVVQLTRQSPLDQEMYEYLLNSGLTGMMLLDELYEAGQPISVVFSREALEARHDLEIKRSDGADDEAADEDGNGGSGDETDGEAPGGE